MYFWRLSLRWIISRLWFLVLTISLIAAVYLLLAQRINDPWPRKDVTNIKPHAEMKVAPNKRDVDGFEAQKQIDRCITPEDFKREMNDLVARRGIWEDPCYGNKMQDFFRAWFSVDPIDALKGVGMLPEAQEGFLDGDVMRRDALLCSAVAQYEQYPIEFIKAADNMLSQSSARDLKSKVVRAVGSKDLAQGLMLLNSQIGQGDHKNDALDLLFRHWSFKDFRTAILAASKLDFAEDRNVAYNAILRGAEYQPQEQIKWAEQNGMPHELTAKALSKSETLEHSGRRESSLNDEVELLVTQYESEQLKWGKISRDLRNQRQ